MPPQQCQFITMTTTRNTANTTALLPLTLTTMTRPTRTPTTTFYDKKPTTANTLPLVIVRLAGLSEQLHEFFRALFPKRNDFLDKYEDWHPYLNTRQSHSHCLWLAQTCLWIHDYLSSAPTQVTKLFSITSQDSSTSQISEPGLHSQEAEISMWGWRNGKRWPKLWVWKHVQNACVKQCSRCAREKQVQNIGVHWNI